ncbi:MAG: DUF6508 domain-containing protein, partial [bacterium]
TWQGGEKRADGSFTSPYFDLSAPVLEFVRACATHGWVTPGFNWNAWSVTARSYVDEPGLLEAADLSTIQKLITTHVRANRFIEGHLAAVIENGHFAAILVRLHEIRLQL